MKANGEARLRDVSALLNQCIDLNAYWFCTKTYRAYIQASLGADPDIRLVARQPLFSLLMHLKLIRIQGRCLLIGLSSRHTSPLIGFNAKSRSGDC